MRTLEMSKTIVADMVKVTKRDFSKMDDRQKSIGTKVLELAPTIIRYLTDIENDKASSLMKLTKLMSEFEDSIKTETLGWSALQMVKNDIEMFFEENF